MAAVIDICNTASAHLHSEDRVTSISPSDGSTLANRCQTFYPLSRDSALTAHDWFFARKTVNVSLDGDGVYDGMWTYKYGLPTDCLVVREVHPKEFEDPQPFDVEATDTVNILLTDVALARLTYTYKCEDTLRYPTNFLLAISWHLASLLAGPMIGTSKVSSDYALGRYEYYLVKARKDSNDMAKANDNYSYKNYRPEYLPQVQ